MHWKIKILTIKHYFKRFFSSNLFLSRLVPSYAILGPNLLEEIGFENNKPPLVDVVHNGNQPEKTLNKKLGSKNVTLYNLSVFISSCNY
jgi:hypothetical protein